MSSSDGSTGPRERSNRPKCPKCGQVLIKSLFGRCLWCGADLPEELRLPGDGITEFSEQQRSSRRSRCPKCGQVLTKSQFNRCLWCGADLPEELRLAKEEKTGFPEQQKAELADVEKDRPQKEFGADMHSHDWSLKGMSHE